MKTMIPQEREVTYHEVILGPFTRGGDAEVEITRPDEQGEPHKLTLAVPAGLPGERVTIAVEVPPPPRPGRHRRRWRPKPPRAWITQIHTASPLRVPAPCPVFGTCGGCQLQHMSYTAQLTWKEDVVRHLLLEVGNFADPPLLPTVPCDDPWHYRNHMRFSVNRDGQVGLTARGSHRVLPLAACPIAHEQINRVLPVINRYVNARPQVLLRSGTVTGQLLIQPAPAPEVMQELAETKLDLRTETMEEELAGETFRIRPSSFFQTNTAQATKMVRMVLSGLLGNTEQNPNATGALTVVDAYCGVGTFALLLSRHVGHVIAIEESASAIKDARWNLRDTTNAEILKGKVEAMLPTLAARIDGFVIDPPRAGCQSVVLDALIQHPVRRIVYVSCDPSTLARDLDILCHAQNTYHLRSVQPLDMFPQTAHIECVAVLERQGE